MAAAVYVLCTATSAGCAWLLWRSWATSHHRLLLFSAVCFGGLAVNNAVLFLDRVVAPDVDLSALRLGTALAALLVLLAGLIWESA